LSHSIFITGVSSGLGHGLAEYYLEQGHNVLGCSRRKPEDLTQYENFQFVSCDVSDFDAIPDQLESLFSGTSKCDLAILNAGILSPFGDLQETSLDDCKNVMDVNLWSNKIILDWLLPRYPEIRQVVTISSGAAVNGNRGWNAYSISKAALNMLTKLYAQEAPQTHFLAIAPGLIATHMQDILCSLDEDSRFPTLDSLKSRRGTEQMPTAEVLAPKIAAVIEKAPANTVSGEFIDIRKIDW
tara:strand:- start:147 stop:869 length:723 start_codon:yes stop_codon:yes gene_type:complete